MANPAPPSSLIKVSVSGGIGRITLNRPEKRNAINPAMAFEFIKACGEVTAGGARVCILDAEGSVFCSGADFRDPKTPAALQEMYAEMINASFLWVACVKQPVLGAGLSFVAASTIVIAGPQMWVCLPEITSINQFPHGVVARAEPFLNKRWLLALALSGDRCDVHDALRAGLVTQIVASGDEFLIAQKWAEKLAGMEKPVISAARHAWFGSP